VSAGSRTALAERKALLVARTELDRMRLTAAARDVQSLVLPHRGGGGAERRASAAMLIGVAAPVLGMPRLARWLRATTLALTIYRIVRQWRR
jgi:hypothetical protein